MTDQEKTVPLSRHSDIVRSIYAQHRDESRMLAIIVGRQDPDGHRYSGERCVWCGVNYLDRLLHDDEDARCEGERDWDDDWWPLDKVDELLREHRGGDR